MLVDQAGRLSGIFTDSDLARLFERRRDDLLDEPIRNVMATEPRTVPTGSMLVDALAIMAERKISELPVIDDHGGPVGLLDITDLVNTTSLGNGTADSDKAPAAEHPLQMHSTKPKLFDQGEPPAARGA